MLFTTIFNPTPHCFTAITKDAARNFKDPLAEAENVSRSYAVNRCRKYVSAPLPPGSYTVKKAFTILY
jgi:hypothetical protein